MGECPCGSGREYPEHCGRLHAGGVAARAEDVMRARFSAFARGDDAYLVASWHPSTRPKKVRIDPAQRWTRLDVLATLKGDLLDQEGEVEFVAHYERDAKAGSLHELSRFVRDEGRWVYLGAVDAELA